MTKDLLMLKFCPKRQTQNLRSAACFLKSQWEKETSGTGNYLSYRVWHAFAVTMLLLLSVAEIGKPFHGLDHYFKWPIYLTNWGLVLNVIQGSLSAALVYSAYSSRTSSGENRLPKMTTKYNVYWCMHSCAVTVAFGVTAMYWVFIYNPKFHELDLTNCASHLFNSIVMGIDFIVVGHPFQLAHAVYPLIFVTAYVAFNFIYYILGGLSRNGTVTIYELMDWRVPSSCLKFVGGGYIVLTCVHCILYFVYTVKRKIGLLFKWRQYCLENRQPPSIDNTLV